MKTKLNGILTLILALVVQVAFAQQTITGKVSDASGEGLFGATIQVKGTNTGTTTDFDGKFSISAKPEQVLVFSSTGYDPQEITVGSQRVINVTLGTSLDAVVIIGSVFDIGKTRVNGVSAMGEKELAATVGPVSIDRAMQGQMSGVNVTASSTAPGSSANVQVRGAFSPTGGLQNPLYVIDGTYIDAVDVPAINSNNIESLQVLTDASQTALYGSRGANGVIVITTKKGKKGKASVSLNTRFGVTDRFPIRVDLMDARQKLEYENGLSTIRNPLTNALLGLGRARTAAEIATAAETNVNWSDEFYDAGVTESYNVAVSSGTENSNNRFSLGYDTDAGIVKGYDGFQRIALSFNNNTSVGDKFNFGYTVNGVYTTRDDPRDRNNAQSPFAGEIYNNPYASPFNPDGTYSTSSFLNGLGYNALDEIFGTNAEVRNVRLFGSGFAEYFILKDLKVRTQFGGIYDRRQSENFLKPSARLNSFINTRGLKTDTSSDDFDYNWRNEISYGKTFDKHSFKITGATEFQNENFYGLTLSSRTYANDFQNTQNLAGSIDQTSNTVRNRVSRSGLLGVLNYSYDKKYTFDGYVRRDGSSRAGLQNQYGTFYGGSASWDIARESFMESVTAVKSLKLSGSYGTLGDDSVLALYSNFTTIGSGTYGADPASLPSFTIANPDVTWETNEKINVGVAFELFQGSRLRGKIDLFQDTRKDFIFNDDFSTEGGSFNGFSNFGDSRVSGLEIDLNYDVLRTASGFNLSVFGNATFLKYEITSLGVEEEITGYAGGAVIARPGLEPFTHFLVRYAGVNPANGDALYLDANGALTNTYSAQNAVAIDGKSPLPSLFGGFGLRANYKGFDVTANFNYSYGNYVYNLQSLNLHDPSDWRNNKVEAAENYWRNPGDTNVLARPTVLGYQANTTEYLQDASYLSFRNLTFGYTLDSDLLAKVGFSSVRAYIQAQNLAIWSAFEGNPEVGVGSSENAATVGNTVYINGYPQVQSLSLGFDINF